MISYTVSRAVRFPEDVIFAARRYNNVRIVADNGLAWVELSDPMFIDGMWMFRIDGMAETPNAIAAREENDDISRLIGGVNTVGCITGSGAHHTIESAAEEVRRFSLW